MKTNKLSTEDEHQIENLESRYPAIASSFRVLLSILPFGIGTGITELTLDSYLRKKQSRINDFTVHFIKYLDSKNINDKSFLEEFNKEEFEDIFESIILRVHKTRSNRKRRVFAKILADSIFINDFNHDFLETFLDLIDRLTEKQIEILNWYSNDLHKKEPIKEKWSINKSRIEALKKESVENTIEIEKLQKLNSDLEKEIQKISKITIDKSFDIDSSTLAFYKQDLVSKSLLKDIGLSTFDATPYVYLELTEFGQKFLNHLKNE
tara:strand:+ start:86 stop:880 length:795 start_codon:yes stop_codon:yes gene_type:complete